MNFDTRMRNQRMGLESSTSPFSYAAHTGFLEGLILLAVTNSPLFALGPAAISAITTGLAAVAVTAAVVGAQYLFAPKPPKPEDGKVPRTQAIPPRIFAIGRNRIAGYYMLWEASGDKLLAVQALSGHRISSIDKFWLHDDEVSIDGSGYVQEMEDGRYKNDRVRLFHRLGEVPETPYSEIVALLGTTGQWTENHRGDGQASMAMICSAPGAEKFQEIFPHGPPQASAEGDWALLYDWRDPTQDINDPSTWKFSKNAALALAWHMCFNPFGEQQDFNRAILPVLDLWTEEADICDEDIARADGGTEKRYEVNGWATTETDLIGITNSILAACDGHLVRRGDGTVILTVGKFRESRVETITDADIVGHTLQTDYAEEESINRLVPKFTYPATGYTTTDTDYFESAADQLRDGRILAQDASFEWVHNWRQARRLGKREWLRRQEKIHGTLNVRLSGMNAAYSRWVRLQTPLRFPSLNGKLIENRRAIISLMQGGFQLDWVKHPDDIDAWNAATDEGSAPPVPPKVYGDGLPTATIDTVTAISSGSSVRLRVVIVDPIREDLTPQVRYRIKDAGGGTPGSWVTQEFPDAGPSAGLIVMDTNPVTPDEELEVQAGFKATGGSSSDWRPEPPAEITSTVDTTPPQALLTFSASGGAGQFTANFGTENDSHLSRVAIYKVPSGGTLNRATHEVSRPAVAPGVAYALPITSTAGTFDIYAEPLNVSGVPGPLSGPAPATVT